MEARDLPGVAAERRFLAAAAGTAALLVAVAIPLLDGPVARAVQRSPEALHRAVAGATHAFEIVAGYPITGYFWGLLLFASGLAAWALRRRPAVAGALLFVGSSHLVTRLIVTTGKTVAGRMRPFEVLGDGPWHDAWRAGGDSFPSGHAAQGWGLYFPLAILFPKLRWPLLVLPLAVSAARVLLNVHYVSDTLGSAAVAGLVTLGFTWVFRRAAVDFPA